MFPVHRSTTVSTLPAEYFKRCSGQAHLAPEQYLAVLMLADDMRMHIAGINVAVLNYTIVETCGIKNGSGTDDLSGWQPGMF